MKNSVSTKKSIMFLTGLISLTVFPALLMQANCFAAEKNEHFKNRIDYGINSTVAEYRPALAVRASGCMTCHAEVSSNYITDFGYGSPYFFADPAGKNKTGIFSGHIYGDFIASADKTAWLTADFKKDIIVPYAPVGFDIGKASGDTLKDKTLFREAFRARSLAGYLKALEAQKTAPAKVIEKKEIFIGAPDKAALMKRFAIKPGDKTDIKFIDKNQRIYHEVKGIGLSRDGNYYTNSGEIECDGDLFINGTLFLDRPVISEETGCRIYAAGPVFLQGEITFNNQGGRADKNNLQIVSSEAIFLGVGHKKCNSKTEADPLSLRLLKTPSRPSIYTRSNYRDNVSPEKYTQELYNKAMLLPLEDSSCHDEKKGYSGLLLNAPVINSRYSGKFKGLVICEFALFWQGKTRFEFDPVFMEVPVLPVLKKSDYLVIE